MEEYIEDLLEWHAATHEPLADEPPPCDDDGVDM